jgi:HEAT repeat protein
MKSISTFASGSLLLVAALTLGADTEQIRALAEKGSQGIPEIAKYLSSPEVPVRVEAVKSIVSIGTQHSLAPLVRALEDPDPEVQIRATDGLVNFYLPEYVNNSMSTSVKRSGGTVSGKLKEPSGQAVPSYITVRPEIVGGITQVAAGSVSRDAKANAVRALGVLRGKAGLPALEQNLRSKDSTLIYESLIAMQMIGDVSAGPGVVFLLRDLDDKVQATAIETAGLLRVKDALPILKGIVESPRTENVRRSALSAMAMIPEPANREMFRRYLSDKDEKLRAAAAEGLGRLKNPADRPAVMQAYQEERKAGAKLSMAFGTAALGNLDSSAAGPIGYLVSQLDSRSWVGVAQPLLLELARDSGVIESLYPFLSSGKRNQKIALARILAECGDKKSIGMLEPLVRDPDAEVADASLRALRVLKARLP